MIFESAMCIIVMIIVMIDYMGVIIGAMVIIIGRLRTMDIIVYICTYINWGQLIYYVSNWYLSLVNI